MKRTLLKALILTFAITVPTSPVRAQGSGVATNRPELHVSNAYRSCFFDLHPELTQAEFDEFTKELGSILRPRQLSDATTLGRGRFDLGLEFSHAGIDDSKGAWNNTMSHPSSDHYLGDAIQFPKVFARLGVSDRVDVGVSGGLDPRSNWGLATVDAKIALVRQGPARPVSLAIRPSLASLIGPREVWVGSAGIDISISRAMGPWSPYAGFSSLASLGVERSDDVDLDKSLVTTSPVFAGVTYRAGALAFSAEVEHGKLNSYAVRASARF